MKKIIRTLVSVFLVMAMALSITGCVIPQTMDKVVGTYKLTRYSKSYNHSKPTVVYAEGSEWDCYLIVTGNANGYIVDNQAGEWVARPIALTYQYDEKQTTKVAYVNYTDLYTKSEYSCKVTGNTLTWSSPVLEVLNNNKTPNNPFDDPLVLATTTRTYSKESEVIDFSYLTSKVGKINEYTVKEYEYDRAYNAEYYAYDKETGKYTEELVSPYIYSYVDLHVKESKATWYYALKDERVAKVESKKVTLSSDFNTLTFDGKVYTREENSGRYTYTADITVGEKVYEEQYWLTSLSIMSPTDLNNKAAADLQEYNRKNPKDGVDYLTGYEFTVLNPNGTPAQNVEVQLYSSYKAQVDENGKATFTFGDYFRADVYKVYILDWNGQRLEYTGAVNGKTNANTGVYTLKLNEPAPIKADYTFTVTNADGTPATNVEVRILVDDYYVSRWTDGEGVATITTNAGVYEVQTWYNGEQLKFSGVTNNKTQAQTSAYTIKLLNNI